MSHDPRLSYIDNVKLDSGAERNRLVINEGIKKMIASDEQLSERGIRASEHQTRVLEEMGERQTEAFDKMRDTLQEMSSDIVYEIERVSDRLDETNFILKWGFSSVVNSLKKMEATLQSVLDAVKNTEKAWSFARYEECLANYKRGLHREALEDITRAIEGSGEYHIGQRDYRFYVLLGFLRLGRIRNAEQGLIDFKKAEESFLLAGRYSEYEYRGEAADAYLNAGVSAYLNGDAKRALEHINKAIALNSSFLEARFQKAKMLCRIGSVDNVFDALLQPVVECDPMYALKAGDDDDIKKYEQSLKKTIQNAANSLREKSLKIKNQILSSLGEAKNVFSKLRVITISGDVLQNIEDIESSIKKIDAGMKDATLEGYWQGYHAYAEVFNKYKKTLLSQISDILKEENVKSMEENLRKPIVDKHVTYSIKRDKIITPIARIGGFISGLAIFLVLFSGVSTSVYYNKTWKYAVDHSPSFQGLLFLLLFIVLPFISIRAGRFINKYVLAFVLGLLIPSRDSSYSLKYYRVSDLLRDDTGLILELKKEIGGMASSIEVEQTKSGNVLDGTLCCNVELIAVDINRRVDAMRALRDIMGIVELKELHDIVVSGVPKIVKKNVSKSDAENIKKKLEETGATVTLKFTE